MNLNISQTNQVVGGRAVAAFLVHSYEWVGPHETVTVPVDPTIVRQLEAELRKQYPAVEVILENDNVVVICHDVDLSSDNRTHAVVIEIGKAAYAVMRLVNITYRDFDDSQYVVEQDGSMWIAYNGRTDMTYAGPNDYVGEHANP